MGRIRGVDANFYYGECRYCGCGDLKPRNEIIMGALTCELSSSVDDETS